MAEVLSPPATSQSPSPHNNNNTTSNSNNNAPSTPNSTPSPQPVESPEQMQPSASLFSPQPRNPRPQPSERVPSYAKSRMSQYSARSSSRSRPDSTATTPTPFLSSLSYAFVRDFAYPPYHPMHYGPPPSPPSGATTPGSNSEFGNSGRRMSDPMDAIWGSSSLGSSRNGGWGAASPKQDGDNYEGEPLPATSFGLESDYAEDDVVVGPRGKHRKSKSYANMSDYERGRRRESGSHTSGGTNNGGSGSSHHRRSGIHNGTSTAPEMFYFAGPQHDPAGVDTLRMSRSGFSSHRRDSHFAAGGGGGGGGGSGHGGGGAGHNTLPSRSFHLHPSSTNTDLPLETPLDSASSFPLDTIYRYRSPSWDADGYRRDSRSLSSSPPPTFNDPPDELLLRDRENSSANSSANHLLHPNSNHAHAAGAATSSSGGSGRRHRASLNPEDEELFSGASIALYDFEPENANELRLREGQEIMVSYRHGQGWLVAEDPGTGEQGLVPEEYVRLVRDLDMEMWYQQDEGDEGDEEDGSMAAEMERDGSGSGGGEERRGDDADDVDVDDDVPRGGPIDLKGDDGLEMKRTGSKESTGPPAPQRKSEG